MSAASDLGQHGGSASDGGSHDDNYDPCRCDGGGAQPRGGYCWAIPVPRSLNAGDFAVYGYFVSTISKLFFPSSDPIASTLATYAVFGVGFVMRPVGSILFGIYGDRYGRRKALSAVIFLMAFSTLAIGLLPTYEQVGVLALILLVAARPARAPCRRRVGRIDRLHR